MKICNMNRAFTSTSTCMDKTSTGYTRNCPKLLWTSSLDYGPELQCGSALSVKFTARGQNFCMVANTTHNSGTIGVVRSHCSLIYWSTGKPAAPQLLSSSTGTPPATKWTHVNCERLFPNHSHRPRSQRDYSQSIVSPFLNHRQSPAVCVQLREPLQE